MSARSRSHPWFRLPPRQEKLRWLAVCAMWDRAEGNFRAMWSATRTATTADIPEVDVLRFMRGSLRGGA